LKVNKNVTPTAIKNAVIRILEIQAQLEAVKDLYKEQDALTNLLASVLIRKTSSGFMIKNILKYRNKTIRFLPTFYDDKKDIIKTTTWKSSAQRSFSVTID